MIDVHDNTDKVHILIYPNQSMNSNAYWFMFSVFTAMTLIISILIALHGSWTIVPFTSLHLIFVWWGFKKAYQNSEIVEYITIESHQTVIGNSEIGHLQCFETILLQVKLVKDKKNQQSMRLFLLAHDKMREIGLGIIADEKIELSRKIKQELSTFV